ncbi:MAG TPA: OB-fold domain-containing protein [Candidatus Limnocylindria bacterium]|nr:OB-fold domain-containing protein [Candidatus Limnocylindria bacterium]
MFQESTLAFPYKHWTGETIGRFLAGLKEQRTIWGERTATLGVVVPPLGYSEADGSPASGWVAVGPGGVVTAVAVVHEPIAGFHPSERPFAYVLVKLDGADTALVHIVADGLERLRVGSRVEAVWADDEARRGTIRDIAGFRVVG